MITRRLLLWLPAALAAMARDAKVRLRGVLREAGILETPGRGQITLEGDTDTSAVLRDRRLAGETVEAAGEWRSEGRFRVEPVHQRGLFVVKNGTPLVITYWCDVCAIRTYSPGICMCCQEETQLDLRDPGTRDTDPASRNATQ